MTRKKNDELHVTDATFPWVWRPLIQLPVAVNRGFMPELPSRANWRTCMVSLVLNESSVL